MKKLKNKSREIKQGIEEDIEANYTWSQVKTILELYKLDEKEFSEWMCGQTMPVIKVGRKKEVGIYGYDLFRWIQAKTKNSPLIFD